MCPTAHCLTSKVCLISVHKMSMRVCFCVTSYALTCVRKKQLSLRCVPLAIVRPLCFSLAIYNTAVTLAL